MTGRDYVLSRYPDAVSRVTMPSEEQRLEGHRTTYVILRGDGSGGEVVISTPESSEEDAWQSAALLMRAAEPTFPMQIQYAAFHGFAGMSLAIEGERKPTVYAFPFLSAFDLGSSSTTGEFACPLCRMASALANVSRPTPADANQWLWTFKSEGTEQERMRSLGAALRLATEHMAKHGVAADWHTVDVMTSYPGTAYGAIVLRGLGPSLRGRTAITATAVDIRMNDGGLPVELIFHEPKQQADQVGHRAVVCDIETLAKKSGANNSTIFAALFDAPMTIETTAVIERESLTSTKDVLLCDGCTGIGKRKAATSTIGPFYTCDDCHAAVGVRLRTGATLDLISPAISEIEAVISAYYVSEDTCNALRAALSNLRQRVAEVCNWGTVTEEHRA